jgi:hypothetical protein
LLSKPVAAGGDPLAAVFFLPNEAISRGLMPALRNRAMLWRGARHLLAQIGRLSVSMQRRSDQERGN